MTTEDKKFDSSFLDIDPLALDQEWVKQPRLYFKYASMLSDAKKDVDELKAELAVTEADMDRAIRNDPAKFDVGKITDKAMERLIPSTDEYVRVLTALNKAKHRVGILEAAVDALEHKKKALESLVYLHGQSYFAGPSAPEGSRDTVSQMEKNAVRRGLARPRE